MTTDYRFIYFVGIDGSGKTTLSNMLYDDLKKDGKNIKLIWLRMNYLTSKPFLLMCRIIGITKRPCVNGKVFSVHEFYRMPFMGKIIQWTHTLDTFLKFIFLIWIPIKLTDKIIICDRFVFDVFADFAVENRDMTVFDTNLFLLAKKMLISKSITILIDAPKAIIEERRPEVKDYDPDYDLRFKCFDIIKKEKEVITVNNSRDINLTYSNIKKLLQNA